MTTTHPAAGLRRRWQLARIHRYVKRHDDCTKPALREQLLAHGYDPQLVEQVLGEGVQAPSKLVLFLFGFGIILVINLLASTSLRDYWLWILFSEAVGLGGFFVAGDDPMLLARWSWSMRAEDLSDEARLNRRTERGVVHYLGYGFATGMLASLLFI